jgi:hypothetical protein
MKKALLILGMVAAPLAAPAAVIVPDNVFQIGVWAQNSGSFAKWKGRGVNTMIGYESEGGNVSLATWNQRIQAAGLYQIRTPDWANLKADANSPGLQAWMHLDEPDVKKTDPALLQADYNKMKAAANVPVYINLSGGNVNAGNPSVAFLNGYVKAADIVSNDMYPIAGWNNPAWLDKSLKSDKRWNAGTAVTKLRDTYGAGNKTQWAMIETSKQNLSWLPASQRGVTAAEFRGELWNAVNHGAKAIGLFAHSFGIGWPAGFDGTPPEVAAELTKQSARLQALASVLHSPFNPAGFGITDNTSNKLLETSWRYKDGKAYYIVTNQSSLALTGAQFDLVGSSGAASVFGENRTLGVGVGFEKDNFLPYDTHVYQIGNGVPIVPEPAAMMIGGGILLLVVVRRQRRQRDGSGGP